MNMGHWIFGEAMCKIYLVSTSITQFTSSIFLTIMSADRYIAVCHLVSSTKIRTPLVSRIVSILAWCCSITIMLPIILYANVMKQETGATVRYTCQIIWPENVYSMFFSIYSMFLGFIIPIFLIMTFYCMVVKKLHRVAKKTNRPKGKRKSHRKVTKLVLTVILVYIFCWLPYWIGQVSFYIN